ncbi:energy transducer TonB [Arachidicoccus terrestris]|uniref:energy transducer TonB n=1 Tax=Arachidicoccus terrestris TaxID=2875539 RepID=UPI001CC41877|nr:energy transducer TonB [Arachidicoccus terrestris]UAY56674.1 energy transducer TonB [Arachidicoccus terrestris]
MDANKILSSSDLDILFDGRNKEYGAYELRKTYAKRIRIALLGTLAMVVLFVASMFIKPKNDDAAAKKFEVKDVKIENYKKPPPPKKAPPPPPPPKAAPPKIEMKQFTVPKVVKDELVKPDEKPPKQDEKITVGPVTQHGLKMDGALAAPPEVKGIGGTGKGPGSGGTGDGDYNKEFTSVQVEAKYPGGPAAWKKYLERNLRQQTPVDNGAPPGQYVVVVSFLVAKDGTTSEVKAISAPDPDYGTSDEAVRVIERSGKWQPAIQNGRQVIYREKQKIIFQVSE